MRWVQCVYSDRYRIDIGAHVFPTQKYGRIAARIRAACPDYGFVEPQPATWEELGLVHTPEYLDKIRVRGFEVAELAQLELPWTPDVVEGFRLMTGGTIMAARTAITERGNGSWSPVFHVGGGFHHAFANHGEGFCLFNDVAIAVRLLLEAGAIDRAAIVDLDVHHGNGTAFILASEPRVFTFSMHQECNYPAFKPRGSLDIGLADGATDAVYLDRLGPALVDVFGGSPQIVFYLAGADPFVGDQLGGLSLSKAGLRERDRMVLSACRAHGTPIVVVLAGGYARDVEDTVDIHVATFEEVLKVNRAV